MADKSVNQHEFVVSREDTTDNKGVRKSPSLTELARYTMTAVIARCVLLKAAAQPT